MTLLSVENLDRPNGVHIRINPPEPFSIFYIHSIYQDPAVEEFQVEQGAIILKGVRTKSPAVMGYYGFEDLRELHTMNRGLGAVLLLRRGMGEGQTLFMKDRKIHLSEIGEKGDQIRLKVESVSLGKYLLQSTFWKKLAN